jgi:hypothetical protein
MNKETIETPAAPQPQQSSYSDGGPAFPCPDDYNQDGTPIYGPRNLQGMTLRDWFAGQALAGLLGNSNYGPPNSKEDANMAYLIADAMLKAREVLP